jgi:uncharacterized protein
MKIAITGGTGLVGTKLTDVLKAHNHEVIILTRSSNDSKNGVEYVQWLADDASPELYLEGIDAIVNLAGVSLNEGRWTDERKAAIYNSRQEATNEVLRIIRALDTPPEILVNASAIGIYPASLEAEYTEESLEQAHDFLGKTVKMWEGLADQAAAEGVRVIKTRFGVIFDKDAGAFPLLAKPYKMGVGGKLGDGMQWVSWVHVEDVARAIAFCLMEDELSGIVNITAPYPIRMKQVGDAIASVLQKKSWLPVPEAALKLALGEKSQLVLEGQKVLPTVLTEYGYQFNYPTINKALHKLLQ